MEASAETIISQLGIDIDGVAVDDLSGYAVSLSSNGTRVAIGAPGSNVDSSLDKGQVRIYDWTGTAWDQIGGDIDGAAAGDSLGGSVSLSSDGTRVAIGAPLNDRNGEDSGHVRVYGLVDGAWTKIGGDIEGKAAGDLSGFSASLSSDGSRVAIGAQLNDRYGEDSGHVRVYDWNGSAWVQSGNDIDGEAADDRFGFSVSISSDGTRVAIGANLNNGIGSNNSGHVRLFSLYEPPAAPASPAPYTGPLPTGYSDPIRTSGETLVVSGLRLANITSCTIDGIDVEISDISETSFSIVIPEGLSPGQKNIWITYPAGDTYSAGRLLAGHAFTFEAKPEIVSPPAVLAKTNAGSFNGYVAVYAKGQKGKTLSWKIAGKWFKTKISSDFQVFKRKTASVGLDVLVHLYIDGQKQLTKTVRTR